MLEFFGSFEFASPFYFWISLGVILFLVFSPFLLKPKKAFYLNLSYWKKRISFKSKKIWLLIFLTVLTSLFISAALANPQTVTKRSIPSYEKPVMMVIDASGSVTGGSVSDFEEIKEVYYDIISRDLGANFSLLIYSDSHYLTRDFTNKIELLRDTLENEEEIKKISGGTETAQALRTARIFFSQEIQAKQKSLILFSDLIDSIPDIAEEIKKSLSEGIRVYVIVAGGVALASWKINDLRIAVSDSRLKVVWLKDAEGINQICQDLAKMESSLTAETEVVSKKSLLEPFLWALLGLVLLSLIFSETILRKLP